MRRQATYHFPARVGILAAVWCAALPSSAMAGHGRPAADQPATAVVEQAILGEEVAAPPAPRDVPPSDAVRPDRRQAGVPPPRPPRSRHAQPAPRSPERRTRVAPPATPAPLPAAPAVPPTAGTTASPPRAGSRPGGGREQPRGARPGTRRLQVDIARSPRELPGSGSAGAEAAADAAAAACVLAAIVLLTLTALTLMSRYAERRLSSLLWSDRVRFPG